VGLQYVLFTENKWNDPMNSDEFGQTHKEYEMLLQPCIAEPTTKHRRSRSEIWFSGSTCLRKSSGQRQQRHTSVTW
jgi:hypothetical protein